MYLGVDLGGTNIAVGLVDDNLNIIHKDSVATEAHKQGEDIVGDISSLCIKVLSQTNTEVSSVKWIGIGLPGTPDVKEGKSIYANNLNLRNTPIRTLIQQVLPLPVYIENDANCAALGEAYAGATKGVDNSIMITIGTGIGGGIIINKKIYSGFNYAGAELGHIVIVVDGVECTCGRKGCWETYGSASALIKQTKVAIADNPGSLLEEIIDGKPENVNGKTAFDAMRAGCPIGTAVVENYIKYFAAGVVNVINIFQPEILVLGGGVSKEGDFLIAPLKRIVENEVYSRDVEQIQIRIATLGNDAGIIGAAVLGF
ncbi:MAG: ROK family glucokinase [Clostridiaceae bacterium]|nr:ROK family glucokinase [Clostridiaceae bacterium]